MMRGLIALAVLGSVSASAQEMTLNGRALEVSTGAALRCMRVELLNTDGVAVDSTETVRRGDFSVTAPVAGRYRLRIGVPNYTESMTEPIEFPLRSRDRRRFLLPVVVDAVALDSAVEANSGRQVVMDRRSRGPGYPIDMIAEGRSGRVVMLYSILPDGRVDRSTAFPLQATHESFLTAVVMGIRGYRYRRDLIPKGRPCFLVTQPFLFNLEQRP